MKVYTLGMHGLVPTGVGAAIGLQKYRSQADVFVAAATKAAAYAFLTECHMAPSSINDKEFKVAMGDKVEALIFAGALPEGAIVAMQPNSANTPTVWVSVDGIVRFGEFFRGRFLPDQDLVGGGTATAQEETVQEEAAQEGAAGHGEALDSDERGLLLARLTSSAQKIPQIKAELAQAWADRAYLCLRAVELGVVEEAAREIGVTPARIYQLKDKALRGLQR